MGVRICAVMLVLWLLFDAAAAQTLPSASLETALPSAPLQMKLPSASLPQRTREAPIRPLRSDLFRAGPETFAPRFDRLSGFDPRLVPCCGPFLGGVFVPFKPWWEHSTVRRAPPVQRFGYLRLLVEPGTAQVYIDGFYMGTVDDVRRLVSLEVGPHEVQLRATGYETVAFDVRIAPNETLTYRTVLQSMAAVEKRAAAARGVPKTFYVIPNCYAGDKQPESSALPRSCDIAKLRTIPPMTNVVRRTPLVP